MNDCRKCGLVIQPEEEIEITEYKTDGVDKFYQHKTCTELLSDMDNE